MDYNAKLTFTEALYRAAQAYDLIAEAMGFYRPDIFDLLKNADFDYPFTLESYRADIKKVKQQILKELAQSINCDSAHPNTELPKILMN